jgi:hypothetical protein
MDFRARVPPPPLDAFVATVWACHNEAQPPDLERILPSGSAQLIVNPSASDQDAVGVFGIRIRLLY